MSVITESIVASGHGGLSPWMLAVHSTANPGATARNHADYWAGNPDYAVHLVSDWDECLHTVPYDRLCWQVGNGNHTCEGIEICEAENQADFERGIHIAAAAVRERLDARGWGVSAVHPHAWFTDEYGGSDHTDPIGYFQRFGWTWNDFINLVENGEEDNMQPQDVWNYDYDEGMPGGNCFEALKWTARQAQALASTDASGAEAETGEHVNTGADMPTRLAYMEARQMKMERALNAIAEKLGVD